MRPKSPNRIFIPATWPRVSTALLLAFSGSSQAQDILRGGGYTAPSTPRAAATGSESSGVQAAQSRAAAQDALARTTQIVASVQNAQAAARAAAAQQNNAGGNLPQVPNGLGTGGLKVANGAVAGGSLWQGANLPVQATRAATPTVPGAEVVTVKQTSQQALLTWESFNVGRGTELYFDQTAGGASRNQWIAFNKVNDPTGVPSQILGSIKAEGQVYVINQNGIIFGGSSQVNTHTLVASSLPLNQNLVDRGLLNNPDSQFLFSALAQPAGKNGTPAMTPDAGYAPNGRIGDVVVQAGAKITSPTSADKVGGRVALIGPNVTNAGTIETPDGQTILAAGLQVGMVAHNTNDATLRGLDVFVGAVTDPSSVIPAYAGTAVNSGIISAARASVTMTGKEVRNAGVIDSSTSVSLNGRIDLNASYNAVSTNGADGLPAPFLYQNNSTGTVTLGEDSVTRILPELASTEKVVGTKLALNSKVNITGLAIHMEENSTLLAPSADVALNAGVWAYRPQESPPLSDFVLRNGQIYLDPGAILSVAGTAGVSVPVSQNFVTAELRAAELADSPLLRDSALRGQTVIVDIRNTGTYNGKAWVGSPIADVSGYANLIQRTVGQLTVAGGTVKLNAGDSVVVQQGATIDVSAGWINYTGAYVQATRLLSGGKVIDIAQATPDRVYEGIYNARGTVVHGQWNITESYPSLGPNGQRYEAGGVFGASGGSLAITAPGMALDGTLTGTTVAGDIQRGQPPQASSLTLNFQREDLAAPHLPESPTPPDVIFQNPGTVTAAGDFGFDASGLPLPLSAERLSEVFLSPSLFTTDGFGSMAVTNSLGDITVPAGVTLAGAALGSISLTGANVTVNGSITSPGGTVSLTAFTVSPYTVVTDTLPSPNAGRGTVTVGSGAVISTAGRTVDDRLSSTDLPGIPAVLNGGGININGYHTLLAEGSRLDVSGGLLIGATGRLTYGSGGGIVVKGGQDPGYASVNGGTLNLGATMTGYSGGKGGTLSVTAPAVQVGGTAPAGVLKLDPSFFTQGGFTSYVFTGTGMSTGTAGQYIPGVTIAPGTRINPVAENLMAVLNGTQGGVNLTRILQPEGVRSPVNISFSAPGVSNSFVPGSAPIVRGDLVMGAGSSIVTDAKASVSLSGQTVDLLGSITAPGGSISVSGSSNTQSLFVGSIVPVTTVHVGPESVLSTAGKVVLTPDPRGNRTGSVLPGGTVSLSGNIAAEAGSVIDVSGTSGELDVAPGYLGSSYLDNNTLAGSDVVRTRIDSNAGSITLNGGQQLFVDSTLRGAAGGAGALGGSLRVSSGRFLNQETFNVLSPTLRVTQGGFSLPAGEGGIRETVTAANGTPLQGMGYFTADQFNSSGLASLTLSGSVLFDGNVSLSASRNLTVATSGVLLANGNVTLNAPAVALGQAFAVPQLPAELLSYAPFADTFFPPVTGTGNLTVNADLIDVGNLSLQGIGTVNLNAVNGDIRGNGTFDLAGRLTMRAGQIYPTTAAVFTIAAYDYQKDGVAQQGTVTIEKGGTRQLPYSAGGTLNVHASVINQGGTLRAPVGTINLGWDGSGTAPIDPITKLPVPVTKTLTVSSGSLTSVSSIDPVTGKAVVLPYGLNPEGTAWIDPSGNDITRLGPPAKSINLSGLNVDVKSGGTLDISGGGDLYAYRWVQGNGGSRDVLNSTTSFAVIPGYSAEYAPYAPFNTSAQATTALKGDPGYVNGTLVAGDRIYLDGSTGLPAGVYTLLPAHYALLPGAFLVTPKTATPGGTITQPDKSSLVAGYRFTSANPGGENVLRSSFEVASSAVVRTRSQYEDYKASTFFTQVATNTDTAVLRLPTDAGRLLLAAAQSISFSGTLNASAPEKARGGLVDISSPSDIVVTGPGTTVAEGTLALNSADLSAFNAQSLLIGGFRESTGAGTEVTVTANSVTVDNAGSPLRGQDLILVSNSSLTVAEGAEIIQSGTAAAETLVFGNAATAGSGNGTMLRLSGDATAGILRNGITSASGPRLTIGANASLTGTSVTLDSTAATVLDPAASLVSNAISLNSGRISIALDNAGTLQPDAGLILSGDALRDLQNSQSLSFLSYSSLDIYGTGQVGRDTTKNLALHAAEIRGFNNGGGTATFTAQSIALDNIGKGSVPGSTGAAQGTLELKGGTMLLGANDVRVDQFSNLRLTATGGILATGSGTLSTGQAATLTTPVLTGAAGVTRGIQAGGALEILAPAGGGTATVTGGLGASLALTGASVSNNASILLPSGNLSLTATSGDLVAGGRLDTSGTAQKFYDVTKYTDGGRVTLTANSGSVTVPSGGSVSVMANAGGGNAGSLAINAPSGTVTLEGTLSGAGGTGGKSGSASITAGSLPSLASFDALLNAAKFNEARHYRAISGDVAMDGSAKAHTYSVAADQGSLTVSGTIDASGVEGGDITLQANGSLILTPTARLSAAGQKFSSSGKGGSALLEAGTQRNGVLNTSALLDMQSGSVVDLSIAAKDANSASKGLFSGTLHLRAPQTASGTDLQANAINSTISGASSIVVEAYKLYDLTSSGGTINAAVQTSVMANGTALGGAADAIANRLLAGNAGLRGITSIQTGAEIINRTGDLTLASTWDLSTFRFGPDNAPGVLTMRAAGNLNFNFLSSLSDGFGGNASAPLWQQGLLAEGTRSWSYRLSAGADLSAADYQAVQSLSSLAAGKGSLVIGSNGTASAMALPTATVNVLRDAIITARYQTIRTGTGDIEINAGRDVQILNPLGTIYTAGTQASAMANFDLADLSYGNNNQLGVSQASFPVIPPQYSLNGGDVSINAQNDIARYRLVGSGASAQLVADSTREMPTNWLYRRSYVDPVTGQFAATRTGKEISSTSWWVDFTNFFEGVGALGGGDVTMIAGRDVSNVDAVIPTNARMPKGTPDASALLELGGGDLVVKAGRNIDGGVYYVERGTGTIAAGDSIKTNSTRAALTQSDISALQIQGKVPDSTSWLPTTLFAGKSTFDVSAGGDLLLGQVANAFLLPQGINNTYYQKTYFSTYSQTAGVTASSLGGNVTVQSDPGGDRPGTLQAWYNNVLRYTNNSELTFARSQPWLKLVELNLAPFGTAAALLPGTLRVTAFSGDINLAGNLTLSPAATGTIDFAAAGDINGLQPNSLDTATGKYLWAGSTINLSDSDPARLPGITAPLNLPGLATNTWLQTLATVFDTFNFQFSESGSTTGNYAVLQTKQALHAAGVLHASDTTPVRLYALDGDISGLTLFSGKSGQIFAGGDISDISLYLQNVRASDVSIVSSGRDIVAYNPNSVLRTIAQSGNNILDPTIPGKPNAGDIQISGPGTLEVLAGRNLDLGVGPNNADRTALGIVSIGNARNPSLPFEGADIVAGAGLGAAGGFTNPNIDFAAFIAKYVTTATEFPIVDAASEKHYYLTELDLTDTVRAIKYEDFLKLTPEQQEQAATRALEAFNAMPEQQQKLVALNIFYRLLRDTGRARSKTGDYKVGETAIATLFKGKAWTGDIALTSRLIKTQSGGDISLFAPGGKLTVGLDATGNQALDQGLLTEAGGTINIFTDKSVAVGTSRIFTLRGGDEIIWSSNGDIAAGASSKTVQSAPPTRVLIDPQSGDVKTDLAGLATGGGIGVLATVAGVAAGNVDLIAPKGTIDAGDAGIRVTGNINLSANTVANGGNIAAGGSSTGTPAVASSGSTAAPPPPPVTPQGSDKPTTPGQTDSTKPQVTQVDPASLINVEVLSYGGGGEGVEEDKDKERRRKKEQEDAKKAEEAKKDGEDTKKDAEGTATPPSSGGQ